jgi:S-adenosylmethionine hydrolase
MAPAVGLARQTASPRTPGRPDTMPLITLTTDFGIGSPYLAEMKGVILSINPAAQIVDVAHNVPAQDIRSGSVILARVVPWFPPGTIHIAVVDPGVGTERPLVYARFDDQIVLAPDNGLLGRLAAKVKPGRIVHLTNSEHWLPVVAPTFHGRDILAPVAAQLTLGLDPDRLGTLQHELVPLPWPEPVAEPDTLVGEIVWMDSFGNMQSNITADHLAAFGPREELVVTCGSFHFRQVHGTYGDAKPGTPIALVSSSNHLEVAVVGGNAGQQLKIAIGDPVRVQRV